MKQTIGATVTINDDHGYLYYVSLDGRRPAPFLTQRHVQAILDIADDGTLAGIELIDAMPPPPVSKSTISITGSATIPAWAGKVVDMMIHNGHVFVACEFGVFCQYNADGPFQALGFVKP